MTENELSRLVIGGAMKVHSALGPGSAGISIRGLLTARTDPVRIESQKDLPLVYEEVKLDCGFRVDLLVDDKLILEVKAADRLAEIFFAQVLTYLRLSGLRLALLLNFNVVHMKDGIRRVVNNL